MSGGYQMLQHPPYPADCIPQWGMVGTFSPHFFLPPLDPILFLTQMIIGPLEFRGGFIKARPEFPAHLTHRPSSCSRAATCAQYYQQAHLGYATVTLPTRSH
jgi:hypothetical protein